MASGSRILLKFVKEGIDAFLGLTVKFEDGLRYPSEKYFCHSQKYLLLKTVILNVVADPLEEETRTVGQTVPQFLFSFDRGSVNQNYTFTISTYRPYCGLS